MQVEANQTLVSRDLLVVQPVEVALVPFGGCRNGVRVAQVADPTMAVLRQVLDAAPHAVRVVGHDRIGLDGRGRPVDKDERRARLALGQEVSVIVARRLNDQAVDTPRRKGEDKPSFAVFVLVRAAGEHQHASLHGHVLDRSMQSGGEGVGDVLEDHTDRCTSAIRSAQRAGAVVVPVVQPLAGRQHAPSEAGRDPRLAVDHPRDGFEADFGPRRNVAHRGSRLGEDCLGQRLPPAPLRAAKSRR